MYLYFASNGLRYINIILFFSPQFVRDTNEIKIVFSLLIDEVVEKKTEEKVVIIRI